MLYFDSAAATKVPRAVLDFYRVALEAEFANQEAAHSLGYASRKRLESAERELSAAFTGTTAWRVIWGNSGTSLFRLLADSPCISGKRILTSHLEHPALAAQLRRTATSVKFLDADRRTGLLRLAPETAKNTDAAALHQIQSELGIHQNLDEILPQLPRRCFRFADSIQAAGKYRLPLTADAVAVSGHKFGAPGGAALLLKPDSPFTPVLLKFAERCRHTAYNCARPEPALMRTLAFAAALRAETMRRDAEHIASLQTLLRSLLPQFPATIPQESASAYICHLLLPGFDSGVVVRMLSEHGIMTAAGSACSAESGTPSPALAALGYGRRDGYSGLRISFAPENNAEEVKKFAATLVEVLKNY